MVDRSHQRAPSRRAPTRECEGGVDGRAPVDTTTRWRLSTARDSQSRSRRMSPSVAILTRLRVVVTVRANGARVGAYTLRDRLAVGGMSEVYTATNAQGVTVVVKVLSDRHRRDPVFREILHREGMLGRAIGHPNVVSVLDAGEEDAEPYLVLEYVDGVDLWRLQRALQHTMRRMEAPLACHVVRELLSGIAHVHELKGADGHGLIHRDVSPSNVFLSMVGEVKLGDLGIAVQSRGTLTSPHAAPGARLEAVQPGAINRGKVGYMAAEQLLGQAVDHRVDLFAAGVVLAEVLTGRALFSQEPDPARTLAARDAEVDALIDVLADHPPSLVSVVLRALARSPAERFQTADEFRAALATHAGDPSEARPLLAALVSWARSAGKALAREAPPSDEATTRERLSDVSPASAQEVSSTEVTREVPLAFYEVRGDAVTSRGRFTWARLLEMAFAGTLTADDVITGPDGEARRACDMPDLAPHLDPRSAATSEVAGTVADWAETMPGCSFLHALARLVFHEDSGMLVAENAPTRREVYVFKGRPTHLASNLASEMMGEYLVTNGALTRGELDMALAMMPRFEGRLQRAIVQLDLLEESRLAQLCDALSRERLMDLFRWRRGTLRFFRGVSPPPTSLPLLVDPFEVLRAAPQHLEDPMGYFLPTLDRRIGPGAPIKGVHRLGMGPIGHELVALSDGRITVRSLVQRVAAERRAQPLEVFRELYLLLEINALELR